MAYLQNYLDYPILEFRIKLTHNSMEYLVDFIHKILNSMQIRENLIVNSDYFDDNFENLNFNS